MNNGWIGVDLDGTLAHYEGWQGGAHIGKPVPPMVERVKAWLAAGTEVRIFTARIWPHTDVIDCHRYPNDGEWPFEGTAGLTERMKEVAVSVNAIRSWCVIHIGRELAITCVKDFAMIEIWDDRAVQVTINTGETVEDRMRKAFGNRPRTI